MDYDEISDEPPNKKDSKESKTNQVLETSTQGNNYFTLTPTEEEDEKDGGITDGVSFSLLLLIVMIDRAMLFFICHFAAGTNSGSKL